MVASFLAGMEPRRRDSSQLGIEWTLQYQIVYVSHEMNQTFLLRASQRVVSAVEIGNQYAGKSTQDPLEQVRGLAEVVVSTADGRQPGWLFQRIAADGSQSVQSSRPAYPY